MTSSQISALFSVSRETEQRLATYADLVKRWNPKINLVSKTDLDDLTNRHVLDSAQLLDHADLQDAHTWVDLGSGGGFPGLVVAILAAEKAPHLNVQLVESDKRKATFLRTVIRATDVRAQVHADRIETVEPLKADILSARALAPLPRLLQLADRHMKQNSVAFLPKGKGWKQEILDAEQQWHFTCRAHESITNSDAVVLEIRDLSNV